MSSTSLRLARWGLVILIGGAVVLAGLFQTGVGRALLIKAGLSQGSAGYTSLSFLHPQSLPDRLRSRNARVGASFVIHNATNATQDYHWSVVLVRDGQNRHVDAGMVRLSSGHSAVIGQSVAITCSRARVRIVVSLERPTESIDAWMRCWSGRS